MSRNLKAVSFLAAVLILPLGAFAADPAPAAADAPAKEAPKAAAKAKKKPVVECETSSSRIERKKNGECTTSAAPTRTYTKEEIDSTGQTDVGEALKRLDPRFH